MFEIADAIPNMGSMGHFQVRPIMRTANLKMAHTAPYWVWRRLSRTPISQKLSERFSLNSPSFKVLTSPKFDQNFINFKNSLTIRTANLKMAHTVHIRYGVGYLEHRYLEN